MNQLIKSIEIDEQEAGVIGAALNILVNKINNENGDKELRNQAEELKQKFKSIAKKNRCG